MASTRRRATKAKAAKSFEAEAAYCLRPKRSNVAAAIFYTLAAILVVLAAAVSLNIIANVKEAAAAAQFGVGITIPGVKINQSAPIQNQTALVNGTNVSIILSMTYSGTGLQNISIGILSFWEKITNVKVNESGLIKNVTIAGSGMTWEANHSVTGVTMIFDAAPPSLTAAPQFFNSTFFQKNLTIESDNSFANASASVEVNSSYAFYTLYWHNGTGFVDKTLEFNLKVVNGIANFSGFSTSTVLFRLEGSTSCTESWTCTGWSDSRQCGTRTCTDSNHCGTTNNKPAESATCETAQPAAGGGGGGGGGGGAPVKPAPKSAEKKVAAAKVIEVSPAARELLKIFIRPGEFKKTSFSLTNTGAERLKLTIRQEGLTDFVTLGTSYTELNPGDSRSVELLVLADRQTQPGTYSGKIIVSSEETEELVVNVLLEVAPLKILFDTFLKINTKTKSVLPGEAVIADLAIFNLLGVGKFDVLVIYGIKDYTDKLIVSKQQTIAVETRAGLAAVLEVPRDVLPGQYYMFAVVQLNTTTVGVGSDTFEVLSPLRLGEAAPFGTNLLFIMLIIFLVLTTLLTFVSITGLVRHHMPQKAPLNHLAVAVAKPIVQKLTVPKPPAVPTDKLSAVKPATAAKSESQIVLEKKRQDLAQSAAKLNIEKMQTATARITKLLIAGSKLLNKGEFDSSESYYRTIKHEYEALPQGFAQEKKELYGEILKFYSLLAGQREKVIHERFDRSGSVEHLRLK